MWGTLTVNVASPGQLLLKLLLQPFTTFALQIPDMKIILLSVSNTEPLSLRVKVIVQRHVR